MAIDNIREWSYSLAIPAWCVYESTGFHLGNIGWIANPMLKMLGDVAEAFQFAAEFHGSKIIHHNRGRQCAFLLVQ